MCTHDPLTFKIVFSVVHGHRCFGTRDRSFDGIEELSHLSNKHARLTPILIRQDAVDLL